MAGTHGRSSITWDIKIFSTRFVTRNYRPIVSRDSGATDATMTTEHLAIIHALVEPENPPPRAECSALAGKRNVRLARPPENQKVGPVEIEDTGETYTVC
jgi:hypothetical protein